MRGIAAVLVPLILLLGCRKDIQNKEAVRQGVLDYLGKRSDLMAMDVSVSSVNFGKDEAEAVVYVQAKDGPAAGNGMQMRYVLERKNNRWVVKSKGPRGTDGRNPHGGPSTLPPGHPQIPAPDPGSSK